MERKYALKNLWVARIATDYLLDLYHETKMCHYLPERWTILEWYQEEISGHVVGSISPIFWDQEEEPFREDYPWLRFAEKSEICEQAIPLAETSFLTEQEKQEQYIEKDRLFIIDTELKALPERKKVKQLSASLLQ